jgi:hypothetical protein
LGEKKKSEVKEEMEKLELELDLLYSNHPRGLEKEVEKVLIPEKE